MTRPQTSFAHAACAAAVFALGACANLGATTTGFLGDYSALSPGAEHPNFRRPGLDAARYTAFFIEPVAYRPSRADPHLDQEAIDELTGDYSDKLRAAFTRYYREVSAPGPGVMRVRAAVTAVGRARPALNALTMAVVFVPVTAGGASTEAEVIDSVSGERLAALQSFNNGGRSFLGGPVGYLSQYGQARRAFTLQARELANLVAGPIVH